MASTSDSGQTLGQSADDLEPVSPEQRILDSLPKGTGRFMLARQLTTGAQRCDSASNRRRLGGNTHPAITKTEPYEKSGIGFGSGTRRFRRNIFPEHDQTQLANADWVRGPRLFPGTVLSRVCRLKTS